MHAGEVIDLRQLDTKSLNAAWNKVCRKIFILDHHTSVRENMVFTGTLAFEYLDDKCKMNFRVQDNATLLK